jgi:hypothetical protein
MAAILPFAAIGAFAVWANRTTNLGGSLYTDKDQVETTHKAIIMEYGLSSSFNYALMDRQYMQGGLVTYGVGVDNRASEQLANPNYNPLEELANDTVNLASFDRADTLLSMRVQQSQIVPRKNNQIAIALSEEIHHPDEPSARSEFYVSKFSPAFANPRQILEADLALNQSWETEHDRSLRAWNGSQFLATAHGQSFRYSEN